MFLESDHARREATARLIKGTHNAGPAGDIRKFAFPDLGIELDGTGDLRKRAKAARVASRETARMLEHPETFAPEAVVKVIHKASGSLSTDYVDEAPCDPSLVAMRKIHARGATHMSVMDWVTKNFPPNSDNAIEDRRPRFGDWRDIPTPSQRTAALAPPGSPRHAQSKGRLGAGPQSSNVPDAPAGNDPQGLRAALAAITDLRAAGAKVESPHA